MLLHTSVFKVTKHHLTVVSAGAANLNPSGHVKLQTVPGFGLLESQLISTFGARIGQLHLPFLASENVIADAIMLVTNAVFRMMDVS